MAPLQKFLLAACLALTAAPAAARASIINNGGRNEAPNTARSYTPVPGLDIKARLPPSLNPHVNTSPPAWTSPPEGWFYGTWQVAHSSNVGYQTLHNLEFVSAPVLPSCGGTDTGAATIPGLGKNASCPSPGQVTPPSSAPASPQTCPLGTYPGQNVDLQLYTLNGTGSLVFSAFGYDTPHRTNHPELGVGWDSVYDFTGTGALLGTDNSWELLAWGYDENGDGYLVIYETAVSTGEAPADIDIESRSRTGPSKGTYDAIIRTLKAFGNKELTALVDQVVPLVFDEYYTEEAGFICGPACVDNCELYGNL